MSVVSAVQLVKSIIPPKRARPIVGWVMTAGLMQKTVKVRVPRIVLVPKYRKYVTRHTILLVHDEIGQCDVGDKVELAKSRPYSKFKHHVVSKILVKDPGTEFLRDNPQYARTRLELKATRLQRQVDEAAYKDAERLKRQQQRTQDAEAAFQVVDEATTAAATAAAAATAEPESKPL